MTFERFDVVTVPFPFADRVQSVVRPAIIVSPYAGFGDVAGVALTAMVTSVKRTYWPLDVAIEDLDVAGLRVPCLVRMKLNTIDYGLIDKKIGALSKEDRSRVRASISRLIGG